MQAEDSLSPKKRRNSDLGSQPSLSLASASASSDHKRTRHDNSTMVEHRTCVIQHMLNRLHQTNGFAYTLLSERDHTHYMVSMCFAGETDLDMIDFTLKTVMESGMRATEFCICAKCHDILQRNLAYLADKYQHTKIFVDRIDRLRVLIDALLFDYIAVDIFNKITKLRFKSDVVSYGKVYSFFQTTIMSTSHLLLERMSKMRLLYDIDTAPLFFGPDPRGIEPFYTVLFEKLILVTVDRGIITVSKVTIPDTDDGTVAAFFNEYMAIFIAFEQQNPKSQTIPYITAGGKLGMFGKCKSVEFTNAARALLDNAYSVSVIDQHGIGCTEISAAGIPNVDQYDDTIACLTHLQKSVVDAVFNSFEETTVEYDNIMTGNNIVQLSVLDNLRFCAPDTDTVDPIKATARVNAAAIVVAPQGSGKTSHITPALANGHISSVLAGVTSVNSPAAAAAVAVAEIGVAIVVLPAEIKSDLVAHINTYLRNNTRKDNRPLVTTFVSEKTLTQFIGRNDPSKGIIVVTTHAQFTDTSTNRHESPLQLIKKVIPNSSVMIIVDEAQVYFRNLYCKPNFGLSDAESLPKVVALVPSIPNYATDEDLLATLIHTSTINETTGHRCYLPHQVYTKVTRNKVFHLIPPHGLVDVHVELHDVVKGLNAPSEKLKELADLLYVNARVSQVKLLTLSPDDIKTTLKETITEWFATIKRHAPFIASDLKSLIRTEMAGVTVAKDVIRLLEDAEKLEDAQMHPSLMTPEDAEKLEDAQLTASRIVTREFIMTLVRAIKIMYSHDGKCAICFDDVVSPCSGPGFDYIACRTCITAWLKRHSTDLQSRRHITQEDIIVHAVDESCDNLQFTLKKNLVAIVNNCASALVVFVDSFRSAKDFKNILITDPGVQHKDSRDIFACLEKSKMHFSTICNEFRAAAGSGKRCVFIVIAPDQINGPSFVCSHEAIVFPMKKEFENRDLVQMFTRLVRMNQPSDRVIFRLITPQFGQTKGVDIGALQAKFPKLVVM